MGCGESKNAVATENTITKSKSNNKEDVAETITNETSTTTTLEGESKKDGVQVINKVVEEGGGEVGEITKEEFEGGAKEETKIENVVVATHEKIGSGSENSKDVGEATKMETANGVEELVKEKEKEKEEAAAPAVETETPLAAAAATPTAAAEEEKPLVADQEIVPGSSAEEPKTN